MLKSLHFYLHDISLFHLQLSSSLLSHTVFTGHLFSTASQHCYLTTQMSILGLRHMSRVTSHGSGVSDGVVVVVLLRAVAAVYCRHDVEDVVRCNSENNLEANCQV